MNARAAAVTILAGVLALLALATGASAGCVWVLWVPTAARQRGATPDWSPDETFETKTECRASLERAVAKYKGHKDYAVEGDEVRMAIRAAPRLTWKFYCLPDTVDPRTSRGSGR